MGLGYLNASCSVLPLQTPETLPSSSRLMQYEHFPHFQMWWGLWLQTCDLGLPAALLPPLFIRPAKKEASASFCDFPSGEVTLGVLGSGVW
jgi:hypothetical protein